MTEYRWRMLCRPISVAHHEAGHAIAARAVGAEIEHAFIRRHACDLPLSDGLMVAPIDQRHQGYVGVRWPAESQVTSDAAKLFGALVYISAGPVAHARYERRTQAEMHALITERRRAGDADDAALIAQTVSQLNDDPQERTALKARALRLAQRLVGKHWNVVGGFANLLVAHGTLLPSAFPNTFAGIEPIDEPALLNAARLTPVN